MYLNTLCANKLNYNDDDDDDDDYGYKSNFSQISWLETY